MIQDRKEGFTTTFWQDFSIADRFGIKAIKDTYKRAFREWKTDYLYLTDLVLVLNQKIWQHYKRGDMARAKLYDMLWKEADGYAYNHLRGEEKEYYLTVTD